MAVTLTQAEADAVYTAPKRALNVAPEWQVHRSLIDHQPLDATLSFAVAVDTDVDAARELVVSGKLGGDLAHQIRLCLPRSNRTLVRLCNNEHKGWITRGHWHRYCEVVDGCDEQRSDEEFLPDPPSRTDRDDMLAVFCERLNITGFSRQRSLT